jgi:hypothetical protein
LLLFISHIGSTTGGLLSLRAAESAAARDSSYSTSRRASPRGLGYFYSTTWEAVSLKSISGHISSRRPFNSRGSIRLKARGLRATCPSVFLSEFFGIFLPRFQMDPQPEAAACGSGATPCGVRFCKLHLHTSFGFKTRQAVLEDLRRQFSRTLGTTREDFKIAQTSSGVHSSLGMLRLLLRTFDL